MYIYRRDQRTVICFDSEEELVSSIPVQDVATLLSDEEFVSVTRGVIARRDRIANISYDGVYTTADGRTFQGKKRYLSAHRKLRKILFPEPAPTPVEEFVPPLGFYKKCSLLDDTPLHTVLSS